MKIFYTFTLLLVFFNVQAQFSGSYSPSNWTTTLSSGSNGTINTSLAPASIIITGSDGAGGTNIDIDYTITTAKGGTWSFNWNYHSNDADASPAYDIAGVLINGTFTQLTNNSGPIDQSGTYTSVFVPAGTVVGFRIRATDNTMGDATLNISSFSPPAGVLPLELHSFSARQQESKVALEWKTENEENVSHFVLERSVNSVDYKKLSIINAMNTIQMTYSSTDESPMAGLNYYRLRMVDKDGSYKISKVIPIKINNNSWVLAYPNPAVNEINIIVNSGKKTTEIFGIYDMSGKQVLQQQYQLEQGYNKIGINIKSLSEGTYLIKSELNGITRSFIKI